MAMEPVIAGGIGWHKAVVDIPADAHVLDLVFRDSSDMHVSGGCACTPHRRFDGLTGRFGEGCRVPAEAQHAQQPVAQSRLACAALRCQPLRGASVSQTDLIPPVLSVCLSSLQGGFTDNNKGMDYHVQVAGGTGTMPSLRVVHVASEMAPIAKVGGLCCV